MVNYAAEINCSFDEKPFNEIDSLVLSWLSYLHFPEACTGFRSVAGQNIREVWRTEYFAEMIRTVKSPEETLKLLGCVCASPRFRDMTVHRYTSDSDKASDKQFAAVVFRLKPGLSYIAYRGTDSTFTGWKEDFDLMLPEPVPSQKEAVSYLEKCAQETDDRLLVGGHSKGGNIAVYAAAACDTSVRDRIDAVYSHDGPGVSPEEVQSEGFCAVRDRIHKTLPQSSLIGMIMEQESDYRIVSSNEKGVSQHNPFSWEISEEDFVLREALTADAVFLCHTINRVVKETTPEDQEAVINAVFDILDRTEADSFDELGANLRKELPTLMKESRELDSETVKKAFRILKELAESTVKAIPSVIRRDK